MGTSENHFEDRKSIISKQIAEISRLLGMVPSDDTIIMHDHQTQSELVIADWLSAIRLSFLKLSTSIGKELDISIQ